MELLFTLDSKNYTEDMPVFERFGVRALICKDGLWAMQQSKFGDYKIPGGGVEKGETYHDALHREVLEETGLHVIEDSIKEIGEALEVRRDNFVPNQKYIAHSYFYFCEVDDMVSEVALTESEKRFEYKLAWATLDDIIATNQEVIKEAWQNRDLKFLLWLREYLKEQGRL